MKVSLNWVRMLNEQYQCAAEPAPDGIDALVEKIGAQLGAVEEVIDLGERYVGIVVVKVVSAKKHPNADKLKLCLVDDGGAVKDVPRNDDGHVEVVCGAPNVKAGQLVAWIPPGATVPSSFDKEPFVIESRDIRGQTSHGMLASPKELALGDNHEGILVIEESTEIVKTTEGEIDHSEALASHKAVPAVKPGDSFSKAFQLDDYIIDIENKMFTHRPDLFGQLGVAREIAGIQGHKFVSPPIYKAEKTTGKFGTQRMPLEVKNDVPELVPRFTAQVFRNIKVGPSSVLMQSYLARVGIRPINNIVDITNYFMMLTGQPLHAYDYDKLKTAAIGVRLSKKGEKLALLNGKTITLDDGAVVITDGEKPIGLGGVMGGADTEVDENTKNIILECATFDMNLTRKTAMAYGLFTDAVTRFTKGQSPWQNDRVVAWANGEIIHQAGGVDEGMIYDLKSDIQPNPIIKISRRFINSRLGKNLEVKQMKQLLDNVEFEVNAEGDELTVKAPFWRTDIEIPEDIVEEVGRLHGYDKLPQQLPQRTIAPAERNRLMDFKDQLRLILSESGANEVLTYSFVPEGLMQRTNQNPANAFKLSNALSPSLQYYRFNLIPSLLEKIHPNVKAGYDRFALYEIGKGHDKAHKNDEQLPEEFELLSLVYSASAKAKPAGPAFYEAKAFLLQLAWRLGVELTFMPVEKLPKAPRAQLYEPALTAIISVDDGTYLGIIGELKAPVRRQLKLSDHTAAWEIDIKALLDAAPAVRRYNPLPRYPQTSQDLTLGTSTSYDYQSLCDYLRQYLHEATAPQGYKFKFEPLDIYVPDNSPDFKHTSWRITFWHPEKTLTTEETNRLMDKVAEQAKLGLSAERI